MFYNLCDAGSCIKNTRLTGTDYTYATRYTNSGPDNGVGSCMKMVIVISLIFYTSPCLFCCNLKLSGRTVLVCVVTSRHDYNDILDIYAIVFFSLLMLVLTCLHITLELLTETFCLYLAMSWGQDIYACYLEDNITSCLYLP